MTPNRNPQSRMRLVALDAVRGSALFGVLVINLETIFRVSIFAYYDHYPTGESWLDRGAFYFYTLLFEFKAFPVFSVLFGAALASIADRERGAGRRALPILARRLGFLFALGLAHMLLIFDGDILVVYAVVGLIVLPMLKASPAATLGVAAGFTMICFLPLPIADPFPHGPALVEHTRRAQEMYGAGDWFAITAFRWTEIRDHMLPLLAQTIPKPIALALIGSALWQLGPLRTPGAYRRALLLFATAGIALGLVASALDVASYLRGWPRPGAWGLVVALTNTPLGLAYGAGLLVIFSRPGAPQRSLVVILGAIGRMGLSNYVAQSIVLSFIFYGYGLGQFGKLGAGAGMGIAVAMFTLLAAASWLWLRRFSDGPLEALARRLVYPHRARGGRSSLL